MSDENRQIVTMKPDHDEAIKPSELIQITGHQGLSLNARRAITVLWHNAHRQGIQEGRDYTIHLNDLRPLKHRSLKSVEEVILSLMQTVLTVKLPNGKTRRVQFLGGNDIDDPDRSEGTLTYSFDKRLVEILQDSYIWGKITMPILMAFSSKYAVSLYEHVAQWSNLNYKHFQDFTLEEFRQMLGVEDGKYPRYGPLNKIVITPALMEINALAPFNVQYIPIKTGRKITSVRIAWSKKDTEQLKQAYEEAQRPRVGRRHRIQGTAEMISKPVQGVDDQMRRMRIEQRESRLASDQLLDDNEA